MEGKKGLGDRGGIEGRRGGEEERRGRREGRREKGGGRKVKKGVGRKYSTHRFKLMKPIKPC